MRLCCRRWQPVRSLCIGESVEVGGDVGGLGRADLLEGLQRLPVTPLSLREVTADAVQCPCLVERLGLATPVTDVTVDAQGLPRDPFAGGTDTTESRTGRSGSAGLTRRAARRRLRAVSR